MTRWCAKCHEYVTPVASGDMFHEFACGSCGEPFRDGASEYDDSDVDEEEDYEEDGE